MEGKKRPCECSSAILEVLMADYYFLENFGTQLGTSSEIFRTSSYLFGSFITKSWLSRAKDKAGKYNNGGSVVPPVLSSSALPFSLATDIADQASVPQSQNALLRLSKDVSSGPSPSVHAGKLIIICKNKNKTKQNKKYFGRILWKYIKLQVDKRHDLFLKKKKKKGWWPSLPAGT